MRQDGYPYQALSLEIAPGPGLAYQPFTLKVLNSQNAVVAQAHIQTQQTATLIVPMTPGEPGVFRLHVDNGGLTNSSDSRILNFRVFAIQSLPPRYRYIF